MSLCHAKQLIEYVVLEIEPVRMPNGAPVVLGKVVVLLSFGSLFRDCPSIRIFILHATR